MHQFYGDTARRSKEVKCKGFLGQVEESFRKILSLQLKARPINDIFLNLKVVYGQASEK